MCRDSARGRGDGVPYQNPSIVERHELFSEMENNHEEDPARDDAAVLDDQRGLGHCGNTRVDIRDGNVVTDNTFLSEKRVR